MKIPGMTMSPKPSMAKFFAAKPRSKISIGKITKEDSFISIKCRYVEQKIELCYHDLHLIGASKDFATVTITSVPNTYNKKF
jgi:hypothetical protein